MATLERALEIAARAHAGQKDKGGGPYILHPLRVMAAVEGETAKTVAILHDVIEDTDVSVDDLRAAGFAETVVEPVVFLTHGDDQSYVDYVVRCKTNEVARRVKLADLEDNARLARVLFRPDRIEKDEIRVRRYILSYKYLTDAISEAEFRAAMES